MGIAMKSDVESPTAKIFMHGRSQAVRLPKEFRLPGVEVRISRVGEKVVLEPLTNSFDVKSWRDSARALGAVEFLPEGRPEQPPTHEDGVKFG